MIHVIIGLFQMSMLAFPVSQVSKMRLINQCAINPWFAMLTFLWDEGSDDVILNCCVYFFSFIMQNLIYIVLSRLRISQTVKTSMSCIDAAKSG